MDKYTELLNNPPKLEVKENAREVVITLISSMCDNRYKWTIKKNPDGDFKIYTHGFSFDNFQTKFDKDDIEWEADDNNWDNVFRMINSGTEKIEQIKSR